MFSETRRARAMILWSCKLLEKQTSAQPSIFIVLTYFLWFTDFRNFVEFSCLGPFFPEAIMARAMKLGSCIHLEE